MNVQKYLKFLIGFNIRIDQQSELTNKMDFLVFILLNYIPFRVHISGPVTTQPKTRQVGTCLNIDENLYVLRSPALD